MRMTQIDLSRVLTPKGVRRFLIGGASIAAAAGAAVVLAGPAFANESTSPEAPPTPLAACASTLPLTTPCSVDVTAGATAGTFMVTLPGVGTLNITVDATTNLVTAASVTGLTGFTASTPAIGEDGNRVSVTLTSTTDPNQVYVLKVAVKPPATAGGAPTITAKVKAGEKEETDADDQNEQSGDHEGGNGAALSAPKGHHQGGGGD
jgi:hypothetical protein